MSAECLRVLSLVTATTVQLKTGPARCRWHGRWVLADSVITVLAQPIVGAEPSDFDGLLPAPIHSVTSDLIPDVLVCVQRSGHDPVVVAVDAKKRSSLSAMQPEEVAEAGSKYLWGLRDSEDHEAINLVLIASSAHPQQMHKIDSSRIRPLEVRPDFSDEFQGLLAGVIGTL